MNSKHHVLLAVMLIISLAEAGVNSMSERAEALMEELKMELESNHELASFSAKVLSIIQQLERVDNLIVSYKIEEDGSEGNTTPVKLLFLDESGRTKAVGKVDCKESARAAQKALLERLALNSLPLEILLKRYGIAEGPGEIFVVEKVFNKTSRAFEIDESQVHFVLGNIVVSIRSEDARVSARELAVQIEELLLDAEAFPSDNKEKRVHVPPLVEDTSVYCEATNTGSVIESPEVDQSSSVAIPKTEFPALAGTPESFAHPPRRIRWLIIPGMVGLVAFGWRIARNR